MSRRRTGAMGRQRRTWQTSVLRGRLSKGLKKRPQGQRTKHLPKPRPPRARREPARLKLRPQWPRALGQKLGRLGPRASMSQPWDQGRLGPRLKPKPGELDLTDRRE
jgi:hypothetical protein